MASAKRKIPVRQQILRLRSGQGWLLPPPGSGFPELKNVKRKDSSTGSSSGSCNSKGPLNPQIELEQGSRRLLPHPASQARHPSPGCRERGSSNGLIVYIGVKNLTRGIGLHRDLRP